MYDKVVALESYLRTHYTYSLQVKLPPDQEAVSWFLFRSGHRGYCIYFATAMAILARSLGIPARVVSGYAPGTYDPQLQRQIIRGTDAHSWTQVYFSGYGWVNFEPTAGFSAFSRTLPGLTSTGSKSGSLFGSGTAWGLYQVLGMIVGVLIVIALLLCMLCLLSLQRLRPRAQAGELYRCVCLLATWAGCVPRSWQTPHEYLQRLLLLLPQAAGPLERLCDLYVREQWAHPASAEHPDSTGGLQEVLNLWMQLRPQLVRAILSHWGRLILCKGVFKAVR
jgi:hypothetical protein